MSEVADTNIWAVVKDTTATIATVIAVAIAGVGLRTWNRQLRGTDEYDLSKRLLLATYELEDAISGLRNPWVTGDPIESYNKRWEVVLEATRKLRLTLMETKIVWDKEESKVFHTKVDSHVNMLFVAVNAYVHDQNHNESLLLTPEQETILYAGRSSGRSQEDIYKRDTEVLVSELELFVEPHLKKYRH